MIILKEASSHPMATMSTMTDITRGREPMNVDPIDLPDGTYRGLFYAYCLEIDGKVYKTRFGVRHIRNWAHLESFKIVAGNAYRA